MAPTNNKEVSMSHNLCALPKEQQERVEVEKAAAYVVWKERNGQLAVVVSEPKPRQGRVRERVVW
ncbi:hypothetical protein O23A_p2207 [Aeromonas salmonicida]|nr:hypothetical protein O23A_p2207 [Aeromonas salmonicida]